MTCCHERWGRELHPVHHPAHHHPQGFRATGATATWWDAGQSMGKSFVRSPMGNRLADENISKRFYLVDVGRGRKVQFSLGKRAKYRYREVNRLTRGRWVGKGFCWTSETAVQRLPRPPWFWEAFPAAALPGCSPVTSRRLQPRCFGGCSVCQSGATSQCCRAHSHSALLPAALPRREFSEQDR